MNKVLKGIVLAGGKSTRMGRSKAHICWYGKEQQYYLADLMAGFCEEVFISCRQDQQQNIDKNYQVLSDLYGTSGPLEAILTAFEKYPNHGWMVVACDVPLLDEPTLRYLVEQRDHSKIATAFESPLDGLPEPLTAIWEAKSYELLRSNHQNQNTSLRKILIENEARIIKAPNADALINANTPADAARIEMILQKNASFTG